MEFPAIGVGQWTLTVLHSTDAVPDAENATLQELKDSGSFDDDEELLIKSIDGERTMGIYDYASHKFL